MEPLTINIDALRVAPVITEPFPYFIIPGFIRSEALSEIEEGFPVVEKPGSFPLSSLTYGKNFKKLIDEISGSEMTAIMAEKFKIDLTHRPTMVTARGQCRTTDGQIHTDSRTKLVTVLIYMNGQWEKPGGRLRLLRSGDNLNNMCAEVPPDRGTLVAFKNQSNAWHGHESYDGPRRAIQLNWVCNQGVVWREQYRHRMSAFMKRLWR